MSMSKRISLPMAPPAPTELVPCTACAKCCTYVGVGINAPTTGRIRDRRLWYLYHETSSVYCDGNGEWSVLFETRCRNLGRRPALRDLRGAAAHLPRVRQHGLRRQHRRTAGSHSAIPPSSWSTWRRSGRGSTGTWRGRFVPAHLRREGSGEAAAPAPSSIAGRQPSAPEPAVHVLVVGGTRFLGYLLTWRLLGGGARASPC